MQFDGQEKTTQEQATATPTNRMVKLAKSQNLIRHTELMGQKTETYNRRSLSGDVTSQRPHHSCNFQTFQMTSNRDTLKGAEYNVMYMCDPKNPDIIQKLAIIPSHCLHDHDVCVRRIKQAERPTKRRTSSSDDAADTRRHPSPKRFTRHESEKRRKRILPKTITLTDRFGTERRLRLQRRRHGCQQYPTRDTSNHRHACRKRMSEHGRRSVQHIS